MDVEILIPKTLLERVKRDIDGKTTNEKLLKCLKAGYHIKNSEWKYVQTRISIETYKKLNMKRIQHNPFLTIKNALQLAIHDFVKEVKECE